MTRRNLLQACCLWSLAASCLWEGSLSSELAAANRFRPSTARSRAYSSPQASSRSARSHSVQSHSVRSHSAAARYSTAKSSRQSYTQRYRLYGYSHSSSYPLSHGKRQYGYNARDYMKPVPRIDRTKQPLGYPSPYRYRYYPYYYPWHVYYGFYPYASYNFYRTPWYGHYNYRQYHDLYQSGY